MGLGEEGRGLALIWGLGQFGGGLGAAGFLRRRGYGIRVMDRADPSSLAPALDTLRREPGPGEVRLVPESAEGFDGVELCIVNPAIPPSHPLLGELRARGLEARQEIDLFLEEWPGTVLAVTGTNGKSSTAAMFAAVLHASGTPVLLGGNIGRSLLDEEERWSPEAVAVLELSSFQLARLPEVPRIDHAIFLPLGRDHLSWHGSLEAYHEAKLRLLRLLKPSGQAFALRSCPVLGPRRDPALVHLDPASSETEVPPLRIPGDFQRENARLVLALAGRLGLPPEEVRTALRDFRGLPHRLDEQPPKLGRRFFDNGVSTLPESTGSALKCLCPRAPVRWIAGGRRKEEDDGAWTRLASLGPASVHLFGEAAGDLARILEAAGLSATVHRLLREALERAFAESSEGDILLLSPGCSSHDAFANFRERCRAALAWWDELPSTPIR